MAVTYNSDLVQKKMRHRGIYSGKPYEVRGRIDLPEDTVLGVGDILLGVPVGENQRVLEVSLVVIGDTAGAAGSIGYFQILDDNGDPVVVRRNGPFSEDDQVFTSPTTDDDAYKAAGQLDGYIREEVTGAAVTRLAGPVHIGVIITTGATVGADTEFHIGAMFDGENKAVGALSGDNGDNSYLLDV